MLIYFLNVNIYYVSVVKSFSCIKVLVILSFFFSVNVYYVHSP